MQRQQGALGWVRREELLWVSSWHSTGFLQGIPWELQFAFQFFPGGFSKPTGGLHSNSESQ